MSDFGNYRPDPLPPIVKNLLILNVLVALAQAVFHKESGIGFDLAQKLQLYPIMPEALRSLLESEGHPRYASGERFYPYQIATHMFAHSGFMHLLFNMLGLWMFGRVLEGLWGPKRFLLFYLVCGVGAAACHLLIQYFRCEQLLNAAIANDSASIGRLIGAASPAVGASGAIMGIFAAYAYLFPNTELYVMGAIPVKAKWAVLGMAAYDVFGGVSNSGDNIAHFAHLGGALTGFILVLIWNKTDRKRFY
jgi:membrane associated rhomboid family serine protease